jgi:hypothetical protein
VLAVVLLSVADAEVCCDQAAEMKELPRRTTGPTSMYVLCLILFPLCGFSWDFQVETLSYDFNGVKQFINAGRERHIARKES